MNSLPKTVTRQRRDCDLNPGHSAPESSTLTTRLPSHPLAVSRSRGQMPSPGCRQHLAWSSTFGGSVYDNERQIDHGPRARAIVRPLPASGPRRPSYSLRTANGPARPK